MSATNFYRYRGPVSQKAADPKMQPDEVYNTIRNWIVKEGIYTIKQDQPQPTAGQAWGIMIEEAGETGIGYGLSQALVPGHIVIAGFELPLDQFQAEINRLNPKEREGLIADIQSHLLPMNVMFEFRGLASVAFLQRFYVDDLSEQFFWDRIFQIRKAVVSLLWLLNRRLKPDNDEELPLLIHKATGIHWTGGGPARSSTVKSNTTGRK